MVRTRSRPSSVILSCALGVAATFTAAAPGTAQTVPGEVDRVVIIGAGVGLLDTVLQDNDDFGQDLDVLGDLDGNGVVDLIVGAEGDDGSVGFEAHSGAVHVLLMAADGTLVGHNEIDDTDLAEDLVAEDRFGMSVATLGDLDGDGNVEVAVGVPRGDDGGSLPLADRDAEGAGQAPLDLRARDPRVLQQEALRVGRRDVEGVGAEHDACLIADLERVEARLPLDRDLGDRERRRGVRVTFGQPIERHGASGDGDGGDDPGGDAHRPRDARPEAAHARLEPSEPSAKRGARRRRRQADGARCLALLGADPAVGAHASLVQRALLDDAGDLAARPGVAGCRARRARDARVHEAPFPAAARRAMTSGATRVMSPAPSVITTSPSSTRSMIASATAARGPTQCASR